MLQRASLKDRRENDEESEYNREQPSAQEGEP